MSDVWNQILALEAAVAEKDGLCPGTVAARTVDGWSLALGGLMHRKAIFYGVSIHDCIAQATSYLASGVEQMRIVTSSKI